MKTSKEEKIKRVGLGVSMIYAGLVFWSPMNIGMYIVGMMLIGFGIYAKATEYPEDEKPAKKTRRKRKRKKA